MTEQPYDGMRYWQFLTVTILTCLVAQSIGLLIGALAPTLSVCSTKYIAYSVFFMSQGMVMLGFIEILCFVYVNRVI